jgi:hypothetical protein
MTDISVPSRAPAATTADDTIQPFEVAALDLRGRVVRLGPAVDEILARHRYPEPVSKLLGEAIVLASLLGSALKFEGRFILQTQTDGPVSMLVVDFVTPGHVRACAHFNSERVHAAIATNGASADALLGRGHLAMTIDRGPEASRYQGLVALEGGGLGRRRVHFCRRWCASPLAGGRNPAAIPAQGAGAAAPVRPRSRRRAGRHARARAAGRRRVGGRTLAGLYRGGHRAARSGCLERAPALSSVS